MRSGQIVFSKQGRDKGRAMIILSEEGEYVFLTDGRLRLIANPKKKRVKHIQITNTIVDLTPPCGRALQDADVRKFLASFLKEGG